MKIIFLDIDGVLNWVETKDFIDGFVGLDPANIASFNRIVDAHPDVKIVISSTWRRCTPFQTAYKDFEGLKKLLADRGVRGEIIDHTPIYFSHRSRGHEIRAWLDRHREINQEPFEYVVLDDDRSGMAPYVESRKKHSWETEEEFAERLAEPVEEDLRLRHVVTSWKGYVTQVLPDGKELADPGGLRDQHAEQAVRILNGILNEVAPLDQLVDVPNWEGA